MHQMAAYIDEGLVNNILGRLPYFERKICVGRLILQVPKGYMSTVILGDAKLF
jgi:hypothetical protein